MPGKNLQGPGPARRHMSRMNEPDDRGRGKRRPVDTRKRGLRYEVGVPARIAGSQGSFMDVTIHDVSASGMSIRHPLLVVENDAHALPVGTRISVTFAPDHENAPDDTVSVSAEIARSEPHGVGV